MCGVELCLSFFVFVIGGDNSTYLGDQWRGLAS